MSHKINDMTKLGLLYDIKPDKKPVLEELAKYLAEQYGTRYGEFVVHNVNDDFDRAYDGDEEEDDDNYTLWLVMSKNRRPTELTIDTLLAVADAFMKGFCCLL